MIPGLKMRGKGFRPPTDSQWRRLVRETRLRFPLAFPVRVSRGKRPAWAGEDWEAGSYVYTDAKDRPLSAAVWIDGRVARSQAIDALHHEWAHLLTIEGPHPSGELIHDDRFWTTYGELYRAWHREK